MLHKIEDYTEAKLVAYTQSTEEFSANGIEDVQDLIAFCARVSNPGNQYNFDTSEKLIDYLIKHKHWSPFEMAHATIEITTTRDIARQLLRHSLKVQEFSQRYADPTKELFFVTREARLQDHKNRQNSIETDNKELSSKWEEYQRKMISLANEAYVWAVENGIAKEQARVVLPEGMTVSKLYVAGPIRNFIHYIETRTANGTQKEHVVLAHAIAESIRGIFPHIENYDATIS